MSDMNKGQPEAGHSMQAEEPPTIELRSPGGERLFDPENAVLLGSSCQRCGKTFFPQRALCPDCFTSGVMVERALSRKGVVYASTVVRVPSSLGHPPPYAYGYVDLTDDKLRVISRFTGSAPELFVPGAAVEFTLETVPNNQLGPMLAWAFRLEENK